MDLQIKELLICNFANGLSLAQSVIPMQKDKDDAIQIRILLAQKSFAYGYTYFVLRSEIYERLKEDESAMKEVINYIKNLYESELRNIITEYNNQINESSD